jgi:hypothetical protein
LLKKFNKIRWHSKTNKIKKDERSDEQLKMAEGKFADCMRMGRNENISPEIPEN